MQNRCSVRSAGGRGCLVSEPFFLPGTAGLGFGAEKSQDVLGQSCSWDPAQLPCCSGVFVLGGEEPANTSNSLPIAQPCPAAGAGFGDELLLSGVMPGLGISTFRSEKIVFIFPCFTVEFPGDAIGGTWLHFQFPGYVSCERTFSSVLSELHSRFPRQVVQPQDLLLRHLPGVTLCWNFSLKNQRLLGGE